MNTFLAPQGQQAPPSAPLLAPPAITNLRDPMQQLAALMTPQQSYGAGGGQPQFGLADLMRMLQSSQGQTGTAPIPGQGMGAGPGPGTGGLY